MKFFKKLFSSYILKLNINNRQPHLSEFHQQVIRLNYYLNQSIVTMIMESDIIKEAELVSVEQTGEEQTNTCCTTPDYKQKYLSLVRQKYGWNFIDKVRQHEYTQPQDDDYYDQWKERYVKACEANDEDSLLQSIKQTYSKQLRLALIIDYLGLQFHIITPFLLYFVFEHILAKEYLSNYNKFLIACIIFSRIIRFFSTHYADHKLHEIGMNMYKLFADVIMRKSLECSTLSNKKISISQLSKLMHIDCQKLITYPAKQGLAIEGVFSLMFLSGVIIFLAGIAGFIGICCLLLTMVFRYVLKKSLKRREEELSRETTRRVKTSIQVFSMIKFIKANALESCYFNKLREIRIVEVEKLKAKLFLDISQTIIIVIAKMLILFIIMKIVSIFGGKFDVAIIFCINLSLSSINLQTTVKTFSDVQDVKASVRKIEQFLNAQQMDKSYLSYRKEKAGLAVKVANGNFFWGREQTSQMQIQHKEHLHLRNINVEIKKGQLIALIGAYGSGKSSFANVLLGEMRGMPNSEVVINGSIAYCSQTPWIMNDTVKNNIVFGKDFSSAKYEKAVKYSCLQSDLSIFKNGDSTLIGEKGSTLSGGQKARISLARAIYSDADIFIFDDILSAVDAHVGSYLFNKTIREYLKNKTVLLITHSLYFVEYADHILVFEEGQIVKQGCFAELCDTQILSQVQTAILTKQISKDEKIVIPSVGLQERKEMMRKQIKMEEDEDDEEGTSIGTYDSFKLYIKRNSGCYFIVVTIFFITVIGLLTSYTQVWFNIWAFAPEYKSDKFTFILIGINIVRALLSLLMFSTLYASSIFQTIHDDMIRSLLFAPYRYFEETPFDKIVSRLSNDLSTNDKIFTAEFSLAEIYCQMMLSFAFNIIFVYLSKSQYINIAFFAIYFGIMIYFYQKYFKLDLLAKRLEQSLIIPINSKFSQALNGLSTIRAYKKIYETLNVFNTKLHLFDKASKLRCSVNQKIKEIVIFSANFYAIIILLVIYFYADAFGTLTVFLIFNAFGFQDSIIRFHKTLYEVVARLKGFGRCQQLTRIEPQIGFVEYLHSNYVEDEKFKNEYFGKEIFPKGEVIFQNYSLKYKPQLEEVLKKLSLHVLPGQKIGIVGRTGSGKSTLMLGLLRIIEGWHGKIVIDGTDISTLSLEELRSNINIILQEHFLFTGTIRDNVDPTHHHSDDKIINALQLCGIWEHFQGMNGLETAVTEGGDNLSSGEKQLINIARSLLNPKRIVLIDEATASIDLQTDATIQKVMKKVFADKTVLTIAHRINTILDSDRILVLNKGEIAQFDSPANLLKNENSLFASLYKQSGKMHEK